MQMRPCPAASRATIEPTAASVAPKVRHRLLRALRSFDGDMRMLDTAAQMVRVTSPTAGTLPVYADDREQRQRARLALCWRLQPAARAALR